MTTTRQQGAWLICLLAGIWLGMRAGGANDTDATRDDERQARFSGATSRAGESAKSTTQTNAASAAKTANSKAPDAISGIPPAKQLTLDDLRRLLDANLYEADLRQWMHDLELLPKSLAAADLPAAAAMIWSAKHRFPSMMALVSILDRWAESDPKAVLGWLHTLKGDEKIVKMIRQGVLHTIGKKHPALLWQEVGPTQEWQSEDWIAGGLIGQYFVGDPARLQQFLEATTDSSARYFALNIIAREMAKKDPVGAIAWAKAQPHNQAADEALASLYRTLAEKNPTAAISAVAESSGTLSRLERERIIEGLAENHPAQLRDFIAAGGLQSATMREAGLVGSYLKKSQRDFVALASGIPAGQTRDAFLSSLSFQLSQQGDAEGAWLALKDIPPSLERRSAMWSYAEGRTTGRNIAEMTAWLVTLPTGSDRDSAIAGFARSASKSQPQMACEWSASIADTVYRGEIIEENFNAWHRDDAKASEAWLNKTTSLSAEDKARLMARSAGRSTP